MLVSALQKDFLQVQAVISESFIFHFTLIILILLKLAY